MPTDVQDAGQVVRDYLRALRDPATLRNDDAMAALGWLDSGGGDVIERLKARQQMLELQDPKQRMRELEEQFVRHAKTWAESHGVSEEAFRAEGVTPTVLTAAGWGARRRRSASRTTKATAAPAPAATAPKAAAPKARARVTATDVWIAIPEGEPFTLKWLVEQTGASLATVRKVITDEVKAGHISEEGPDPAHSSRGRAPTLYRWVATDV